MRITKVYTKTGDKGSTRLVGGREVSKGERRIEAYGTVDELNAIVGLARTFNQASTACEDVVMQIEQMLETVQNDLFCVGADLATLPEDRWEGMDRIGTSDITKLEGWIDTLNEELPPLKDFILPGGGPVGAFLHQARTVCRRAERELVRLGDAEPETLDPALPYLNRLSDYFFVLGRWAARGLNEPEYIWKR
jgi:cob(I)alamin adenosyltransferase|tara:strand:- start:171 stop:749 length:579 start_codon:yes stop_codon:yes gene_type:complete